MLTRLKELATQAASANAASNLDKINDEGNALINEIDRIAESTEYAGTKLLDGTFGVAVNATTSTFNAAAGYVSAAGLEASTTYTLTVVTGAALDITVSATIDGQVISQTLNDVARNGAGEESTISFAGLGLSLTIEENFTFANANAKTIVSNDADASDFQVGSKDTDNDRIEINLSGVTSSLLGVEVNQLSTAALAQDFLTAVDTAIDELNDRRGGIGAIQNRLSYASANLATTIENVQAAESVIRDVDMAAEMTTFTKNQILMQAGTAMLGQANMAPQSVLSLLG